MISVALPFGIVADLGPDDVVREQAYLHDSATESSGKVRRVSLVERERGGRFVIVSEWGLIGGAPFPRIIESSADSIAAARSDFARALRSLANAGYRPIPDAEVRP